TATALALRAVGRVVEELQLGEDELRDDERSADKTASNDVSDAAVDDDRCIEQHARVCPIATHAAHALSERAQLVSLDGTGRRPDHSEHHRRHQRCVASYVTREKREPERAEKSVRAPGWMEGHSPESKTALLAFSRWTIAPSASLCCSPRTSSFSPPAPCGSSGASATTSFGPRPRGTSSTTPRSCGSPSWPRTSSLSQSTFRCRCGWPGLRSRSRQPSSPPGECGP